MAAPDLHKFKDDLKNKPGPGSNAPPRTIRANDLDKNFKKVTVAESDEDPKLYELKYTEDGTILTRILPNGKNTGDILYWNGKKWVVLNAVESNVLHVLGIQNSALLWVQTQDCP